MISEPNLFLHISGLVLLTLSLGGMLLARLGDFQERPKMLTVLHGVGLLFLLVAGFGMAARLDIGFPFPVWLWIKLVIWLLLGAFPSVSKRFDAGLGWFIVAGLTILSAYLGVIKPF